MTDDDTTMARYRATIQRRCYKRITISRFKNKMSSNDASRRLVNKLQNYSFFHFALSLTHNFLEILSTLLFLLFHFRLVFVHPKNKIHYVAEI